MKEIQIYDRRDRKYYQDIREEAEVEANHPHINETWMRAYRTLADAADHIDAMMARTEEEPLICDGGDKDIGGDAQMVNLSEEIRTLEEMFVAKTHLPPPLLGLTWSSTERN